MQDHSPDHNSDSNASVLDPSMDKHEEQAAAPIDAPEWKPGYRFKLAFAALAVLAIMVSLDGTSVSVALPIMTEDLHGTAIEAFWTGTSFLLTSAVFQPTIGSLSHIFGRMYAIVFCSIFFLVGIIVSSVAQDFTAMLVGRTIQGIGGGGIILMSDIVITDLVPMRQRGMYFGLIGGCWAIGSVSGPVIGGVLAYKSTWRWIFWINIPFAVIALIMVPSFMRLERTPGSIKEKIARVDWIGAVIFIGSITSFLIPITWGGTQYSWSSARTLAPLIVGSVGIIAFGIYEWFVPGEPMIRLHLFKNFNLSYSLFAALINSLIVYGSLYFLPLYFEAAKGYNPILSGVALFPATLTVAPVSIISGIIISKTGDFRVLTWIGWVATTLGCGVMYMLDANSSVAQWVFLTLCMGIGLGFLYTSLAFVNQSASDDSSMAFAVSLFIFARLLGQCLGVAICGAIFQNQMLIKLSAIPEFAADAVVYSRDAQSLVVTISTMADGGRKTQLVDVYADSLKAVWATMCGLAGAALLLSFFMKYRSLDRELTTDQGLIEAGKRDKNEEN